ncbi:MAG: hypothetical protein GF401_12280 [Chitinivibrionales bacterium]|nr:hypothetical protein [Chitinivibrionales bacterium]
MQEEIVRADKTYRNRLFSGYALGAVFLVLIIKYVIPWFLLQLQELSIPRAMVVIETVAIIFLLSFIGPAYYLIITGRKILKFKRVPYPGMKVIRDTKVKRGKPAFLQARVLIGVGTLSILMSLAGSFMTHYYFVKFKNDPMFKGIFQNPSENRK